MAALLSAGIPGPTYCRASGVLSFFQLSPALARPSEPKPGAREPIARLGSINFALWSATTRPGIARIAFVYSRSKYSVLFRT
jgi:hypothetical protein